MEVRRCSYQGQKLVSDNKKFFVKLHKNGNLVLYRIETNKTKTMIWESKTAKKGKGPYRAIMQDDGNFVLKDGRRKVIWETTPFVKKGGKSPFRVVVEDDGKFALYDTMMKLFWKSP